MPPRADSKIEEEPLKMTKHVAWSAAALFLTVTAASAANHIVDIAWSAEGHFVHARAVEPGKFIERQDKASRR